MLESLPEWIETAKKFLKQPNEPDERLPSEHVIGYYALRWYRPKHIGESILIAAQPYPGAVNAEVFIARHAKKVRGYAPRELLEHDVENLEELVHASDAVRVVPAY